MMEEEEQDKEDEGEGSGHKRIICRLFVCRREMTQLRQSDEMF